MEATVNTTRPTTSYRIYEKEKADIIETARQRGIKPEDFSFNVTGLSDILSVHKMTVKLWIKKLDQRQACRDSNLYSLDDVFEMIDAISYTHSQKRYYSSLKSFLSEEPVSSIYKAGCPSLYADYLKSVGAELMRRMYSSGIWYRLMTSGEVADILCCTTASVNRWARNCGLGRAFDGYSRSDPCQYAPISITRFLYTTPSKDKDEYRSRWEQYIYNREMLVEEFDDDSLINGIGGIITRAAAKKDVQFMYDVVVDRINLECKSGLTVGETEKRHTTFVSWLENTELTLLTKDEAFSAISSLVDVVNGWDFDEDHWIVDTSTDEDVTELCLEGPGSPSEPILVVRRVMIPNI